MASPSWRSLPLRLVLSLAVLPLIVLVAAQSVGPAAAGEASEPEQRYTVECLKTLSPCELEQIFARACPGRMPAGYLRGRLLHLVNVPLPRLAVVGAGLSWKGKHFAADGTFINQFACRRRISSQAFVGPSWFDGKPTIVMQYPPGTPLFGNLRDEFREVSPGLYLGLMYRRCPREFLGYLYLEADPKRCARPYPSCLGHW